MAYDNPAGIIAAAVILELLVAACVGTRMLSRRKTGQKLIVSDYLILLAFVLATGLTVIQIYGCAVSALGVPLGANLLDPKAVTGRLNKSKHIQLAYLLIGIANLGLIKLSVAFFYLRIFSTRVFRRVIIAWIVVLVAWTLTFVIGGLLECGSRLLSLFGEPQSYLDHCGSAIPIGWAMVGSDVATDLITLIIPIPMIWSLKLPTVKKVLLVTTFMIGALSVGASVAKAYIYISASKGYYQLDAILLVTALSVWNLVEVQVGIIAACGPLMQPVLKELIPRETLITIFNSLSKELSKGTKASHSTSYIPYKETPSNEGLVTGGNQSIMPRVKSDVQADEKGSDSIMRPGEIHVARTVAVESV